jgi:hypothetical protein
MPILIALKNLLKVSRNVRIRKDRPNSVVFKIRRKKDLINTIVPIFDKFPMIGAKKHQYNFFRENLIEKNTIHFTDLERAKRSLYKKEKSFHTETTREIIKQRLDLPLFDCWLVGFLNGEGCFSVYQREGERNKTISFSVNQTVDGFFLCSLVQHRFSIFDCNVFYKKEEKSYSIKTTSIENIHNVKDILLNRFESHQIHFYGYKNRQFNRWLYEIKVNKRYRLSTLTINKICFLMI